MIALFTVGIHALIAVLVRRENLCTIGMLKFNVDKAARNKVGATAIDGVYNFREKWYSCFLSMWV